LIEMNESIDEKVFVAAFHLPIVNCSRLGVGDECLRNFSRSGRQNGMPFSENFTPFTMNAFHISLQPARIFVSLVMLTTLLKFFRADCSRQVSCKSLYKSCKVEVSYDFCQLCERFKETFQAKYF